MLAREGKGLVVGILFMEGFPSLNRAYFPDGWINHQLGYFIPSKPSRHWHCSPNRIDCSPTLPKRNVEATNEGLEKKKILARWFFKFPVVNFQVFQGWKRIFGDFKGDNSRMLLYQFAGLSKQFLKQVRRKSFLFGHLKWRQTTRPPLQLVQECWNQTDGTLGCVWKGTGGTHARKVFAENKLLSIFKYCRFSGFSWTHKSP